MFAVNGNFLCRNKTGIERFAWEVCLQLDKIAEKGLLCIYVPLNAPHVPQLSNIEVVFSSHRCTVFPLWDHVIFGAFVKKTRATALDFSNTAPFFNPGFAFLHDVYAKDCPDDFVSAKDKLIRLYSLLMYRTIAHRAKKVFTVSEFSRERISCGFGTDRAAVAVIPNGWDHFEKITPDMSVLTRFPQLKEKEFYFTLGSLSRRKNLKWIAAYAAKHPSCIFAVSGKAISGLVPPEMQELQTLPNVVLTGYTTDGEIKALMTACKAFVFPSYYEGFGIPPLEALSCGVPVAVAKAASLPEIFGGAVHYIDPADPDTDLDELIAAPVQNPAAILQKYTYTQAAQKLYAVLKAAAADTRLQ